MSRRGPFPRRSMRHLLGAALVVMTMPMGRAAGEPAADPELVDCGTMSLAALLMIEGHAADPGMLLARLRPTSPDGPSLAELRDAASACGLRLSGVRLGRDERAIDRPMIVYTRREGRGHFRVVRPVGHTGRLAQVIDPNEDPVVVDKSALIAAPEWTGMALIPGRPPGWATRIGWGLAAGAAAAGGLLAAPRLRRRMAPGT